MASLGLFKHRVRSALALAVVVTALGALTGPVAFAQDANSALRSLVGSGDFRVRVSAALILGRAGSGAPAGALEALESTLADSHPVVRVAAATALGWLGDLRAVPTLEQRVRVDTSPSVVAQARASIGMLKRAANGVDPDPQRAEDSETLQAPRSIPPGARYVIELGTMRSRAGGWGETLRRTLSDAARARVRGLPGTVVVERASPLARQAAARFIPVIVLEGNVMQMTESRVAGGVEVHARVEFTVRRDETLKGTLSGSATAFGPGAVLSDEGRRRLQDDAIDAAVESALRGAEQGLIVAAR